METFPRGTPLDPWYVTGFAEGEGRFTFSRSGRSLALYFALRVGGADAAILRRIQEFFGGIGRIYDRRPAATGGRIGSTYYRVTRIDDLPSVVRHFEDYPLVGSKAEAFDIWRRMVDLKREHYRHPERVDLESLAARLTEATSGRNPDS